MGTATATAFGDKTPGLPHPLGAQDEMGLLELHVWLFPDGHSSISSQLDAPRKPRPAELGAVGDPAVTAHLPRVIPRLPGSALAAFLP